MKLLSRGINTLPLYAVLRSQCVTDILCLHWPYYSATECSQRLESELSMLLNSWNSPWHNLGMFISPEIKYAGFGMCLFPDLCTDLATAETPPSLTSIKIKKVRFRKLRISAVWTLNMLCSLNQLNEYWFWYVISKVYVTFWHRFQVQALENNSFTSK